MNKKINDTSTVLSAIRNRDVFIERFNINVNGSVDPIEFKISSVDENTPIIVTKISFVISASGTLNINELGESESTNGILYQFDTNFPYVVQNNGDILGVSNNVQITSAGIGSNIKTVMMGDYDLLATFENGIISNTNDFKLVVRDNLSTTSYFSILVSGIIL